MKKRWLFLAIGIVLAGGGVVGVLLHLPGLPQTPFRANFDQVRRGMKIEEVHAIMGKPNCVSKIPPIHHASVMVEIKVTEDSPDYPNWILWKEEFSDPGRARVDTSPLLPPESPETAYVFFVNGLVTDKENVRRDSQETTTFTWFFNLLRW
jgi:hypothetical protein